jgi:ribonuclease R
MRYEMGMSVEVKLMEATPLTGGLLFSMQSPPRPRRRDLKAPERPQHYRGGPARKRPNDGGGRPPNVRHSNKKGKASYGKNKKRKGR